MKKILLVITCLLMALFLLPGGMASWEEILSIEGAVEVTEIIKESELSLVISGEGETSPPAGKHIFEQGEEVQVIAFPAEGWEFARWEIDGEKDLFSSNILVYMEYDLAITAVFSEISDDADVGEEIIEESEAPADKDDEISDDDKTKDPKEEKSDPGKPEKDEEKPDENGKDPETEDTSGNDEPEEQVEKEKDKAPEGNGKEEDSNGKEETKE